MPSGPRAVSMVLVSLGLLLLVGGCNGASPETRARQTRTARFGTWTPTPRAEHLVRIERSSRDPDSRGISAHRGAPAVDRTDPQDRPGGDAGLVENAVTDPELTEDLITAAMAKAEARVCVGSRPLLCFPHRLDDALASARPRVAAMSAGSSAGAGGRASTSGSRSARGW